VAGQRVERSVIERPETARQRGRAACAATRKLVQC